MTRLIFLNRYFYPDQSATSQILSDLAFHLAARGRNVHVITGRQLYEDPRAKLPASETINGVHVHRVFSTRFGRSFLPGRAADYLSFYMAVSRRLSALAGRGDIIIAKTDPPMMSVPAARVARRKRARLINWLQDIYPEVAAELGVPALRGPLLSLLTRLRDTSLHTAAANVVVGPSMTDRLRSRGLSADQVRLIANWSDDKSVRPRPRAGNPLRQAWGLGDRFVVGYAGNLGRGHEFDTMLGAAERLRDDPRIVFLLIGGGHRFDVLSQHAKARALAHKFCFIPYQDRSALGDALAVADLHWISLKPALDGLMFPSKFYGAAAAGRPLLAVSAPDGDLAHLVRQYDCGYAVAPGDASAAAAAVVELADDSERRAAMGRRARLAIDTRYSRDHALESWSALIDEIEGQRPGALLPASAAA